MKKHILIAPLNWGLGHATRCIPIINALIEHDFEPIIASDGIALELLKKEFPELIHLNLPPYNIQYSKKGKFLKLKLVFQLPKLFSAISAEKRTVKSIVDTYGIQGIISDNRFGVYSKKIPSVYITHQLNVISGNTTWITSKLHRLVIKRFNECWIPDHRNKPNLSGFLGHLNGSNHQLSLKYIGSLSRFNAYNAKKIFDLLILLSGPEPQRTLLEKKLLEELRFFKGKVILVQGKIKETQVVAVKSQFTIYNYMQTQELEKAINESKLIISRSGYTTIMDLAKLRKRTFFIPTPGQYEQYYLANRLHINKISPYCTQDEFNMDKLKEVEQYKGFYDMDYTQDYEKLFSLFQGE